MSSLWTPDGEHKVPPEPQPDDGPAAAAHGKSANPPAGDPSADTLRAAAEAIGIDLDSLSDEERDQLRSELAEMMRVRREVAATPASEMLTNHMMRLFDLATIYLEDNPPAFQDASTVIEAFRAMLDALGDRLGDSEDTMREALGQLQMLFVQVKDAHAAQQESGSANPPA
jgi:hypothetical protein